MVESKVVALRLTTDDLALIDAIRAKTGMQNRTEIIRLALRRLAELEKVKVPATTRPKPKRQ